MLKQIRQPVLVGSVISDALYVPVDQKNLAFSLPHGELFEIDSEHGHDGFLIDAASFEPRLRRFVERLPGEVGTSGEPARQIVNSAAISLSGLKFTW